MPNTLNRRTFLSAAAAAGTAGAFAGDLFEEARPVARPHRIEQWQQIKDYADRLPVAAFRKPKPGDLADTLKARTGFPAPGLKAQGKERIEQIGEDNLATYHRVWVRVSPAMETYGLWLIPKQRRGRAPLVISQHGGAGFPELALFKGGANYHDMIRGAAKEGYVVFAPLVVMYTKVDAGNSPVPETVRKDLDQALRAKGTSLAAVEVTKIMAALDVLLKRPEVDANRVAMTGLSYGGYYTLYVTALDKRIRVAAPSCCVRDADAITPESTERPEGRLVDLASHELAKLIRPRPLHIQAGINDKAFPIDNVRAAIAKARRHYEAGHAGDRLEFLDFDGGHEFRGEPVWDFFRKRLTS